ncbi:MAG: hypothetical protein ACETVZ_00275 [Phycisphaerae bacterium]
MADKKTGTKEWAETNVNIQLGCEHGCRYCYARYNAVTRFKLCTAKQWLEPAIIRSQVTRSFLKRFGVVMFPSTHDITPRNLSESICVLRKLLAAGNKVLLVSKPHFNCIKPICESFQKYRKRLSFRFTIGSKDGQTLAFWEPNAPGFHERFKCLIYVYHKKYCTSVSCEPFLGDIYKTISLYMMVKRYITDSFWIGKLRDFDNRVDLSGVTPEEMERFVNPLKAAQCDETVWTIYEQLRNERLIKWKDSIREVIEK